MGKYTDRIIRLAQQYREEGESLLLELCNIETGTGDLEGNQKMIEVLQKVFSEMDIQTRTVSSAPGRHLIAEYNPGAANEYILLSAHTDTVFRKGDVEKHPAHIEGDDLYGLGSSDCKGGVVVILQALKIIHALEIVPKYGIAVILNCDEETGSDASNPIFEEFCRNHGVKYCLCFEPSREENGVLTSRMGRGELLIEAFGRRSHCARYWEGESASYALVKALSLLEEINDDEKLFYCNIGELHIDTPINVLPDYASAKAMYLLHDDFSFDDAKSKFKVLESMLEAKGCNIKLTPSIETWPMCATAENKALYQILYKVGKNIGMELPEQSTTGAGDANYISKMVPATVCGMGSYTFGPHVLDEKTTLSSLFERTKLTAEFLAEVK